MIKEHRVHNFAKRFDTARLIHHFDRFAVPFWPVLQECKRDVGAQRWRKRDRRHIALIVHPHRIMIRQIEMCARRQLLDRASGPQPHQPLTLGINQTRARGHRFSDAVFLGGNHTLHPDVIGRHAAMNFGMGDEALFDPQDIQRFHPIGATAHGFGP